jgi:hypothetical protein
MTATASLMAHVWCCLIGGEATTERSKRLSRGESAYFKALAAKTNMSKKVYFCGNQGSEVQAVDREVVCTGSDAGWPAHGAAEQ